MTDRDALGWGTGGGDAVLGAVRHALASAPVGATVLAVSGGRDSMSLLHAVHASGFANRVATVATFHHRTGDAAAQAAALVQREAARLGFTVAVGTAERDMPGATEAEWRAARWAFLRGVASRVGARVATAHSRDDHLETVAFRAWRGTGPRGLAGLDVDGGPLRPLLPVSRADIAAYAAAHGVPFVEDPDNRNLRHARTRWRHELLPAMVAAQPAIGADLLDMAQRAADWRRDVAALVAALVSHEHGPFGAVLRAPALAGVPAAHLAWLWPEMLAPFGIVPDQRALHRLAAGLPPGRAAALPRGALVACVRPGEWVVLPQPPTPPVPQRLVGPVAFGAWRIRPGTPEVSSTGKSGAERDASPWHGRAPADIHVHIRAWRPGDRLAGPAGPRRVARWLADAGIAGPLREGWPVVAAGSNVWWIPGVRQAELPPDAPTLTYVCDR